MQAAELQVFCIILLLYFCTHEKVGCREIVYYSTVSNVQCDKIFFIVLKKRVTRRFLLFGKAVKLH